MPSSLLVCSILYQDQEVDMDLGIFPCLLLFRQHFVYTFLPMDMICIAMCTSLSINQWTPALCQTPKLTRLHVAIRINLNLLDRNKTVAACLESLEVTLYLHSLAEVECAVCASLQHCIASAMLCRMVDAQQSKLQILTTFQKFLDPNL